MCGVLASTRKLSGLQRNLLSHRGPDESYFESINDLNVQFNRLSITGILEGSHPITSPSGRWSVFINGEIYNFQALIASHGLAHTTSDVRVLALGLEKDGISFVRNLRGMFAGLIIDRFEEKTYLLRDFFGEKPLYYSFSDGNFTVASEFRALLNCLDRTINLDTVAMASFVRFGYIEEPWTLDKYIKNVPKGALSEIDSSGIRVVIEIPPTFDGESNLTSIIETVLSETMHLEVPGGLALSGGLDSTAIARRAFMSKNDLKSYIFNFGRSPLSIESLVAYRSTFSNRVPFRRVSFETQNLEDQLESLASINDLPHSDLSGLGYLAILRAIKRDDRKVAFFGHGPDEFFWGYEWFNTLVDSITTITPSNDHLFWNTPAQSSYLLSRVSRDNQENFSKNRTLNSCDPFLKEGDKWQRARAEISHSYLSANGHRQLDRLAMSLGIEPRTPFTDSRIYSWTQNATFDPNRDLAKRKFRLAVQNNRQANRNYRKQGFNTNISFVLSDSRYDTFFLKGMEILNSHNLFENALEFESLSFEDKYRCAMLGYWLIAL
jgi:asparagine synthase (glutamine-hydrolysing)